MLDAIDPNTAAEIFAEVVTNGTPEVSTTALNFLVHNHYKAPGGREQFNSALLFALRSTNRDLTMTAFGMLPSFPSDIADPRRLIPAIAHNLANPDPTIRATAAEALRG